MNEELTRALENVLTIDGRGRPAKARLLLQLVEEVGLEQVKAALKEIGERKFF